MLKYIEEYVMEGERPTRVVILDTDTNTKETNQISMNMIYQ